MFILADYQLRWWRLPFEEWACRKKHLGGDDYLLRNSGLPPSSDQYKHWTKGKESNKF